MKYKVGDKFIVEIQNLYNREFPPSTTQLYQLDGFCNALVNEDDFDKLQKLNPQLKIEDIDDMLAEHDLKKEAYEKGLQDAWELAHKCVAFTDECKFKIFDTNNPYCIIAKNTYQEALAKIESYEKSQQIQVGDVVVYPNNSREYVVINTECNKAISTDLLDSVILSSSGWKKTGRHIDIEHLLEQIRGNE